MHGALIPTSQNPAVSFHAKKIKKYKFDWRSNFQKRSNLFWEEHLLVLSVGRGMERNGCGREPPEEVLPEPC